MNSTRKWCGWALAALVALHAPDWIDSAAAQEADTADEPTAVGEIVVTGTRIRRPQEDFANPVIAVSAQAIESSGRTNIADLLAKTPALVGSQTGALTGGYNASYGETGVNLLDLRNLGVARTLVLVDGRRHVSSVEGSAAVDIESIPTDLIESVDVLTGGASAIYGADGVSGVVNFRMKKNFEGLSFRGQAGTSGYGDGTNRFAGLTFGHNFAEQRGNVSLAFEYSLDDRVNDQRRAFLRNPTAGGLYRNRAVTAIDPNSPKYLPYYDVRFADSSTTGAVDVDFDNIPDYEGGGQLYDRGNVLLGSGGYTVGGSSTPVDGYQGDLFPRLKRAIVNGLGHFDISDHLTVFAEGKYADVSARTQQQPTFDVYQFIAADNPYIPQAIRGSIVPGAAAAYFGAPYPDGVLVTRDDYDLGINFEDTRRRTLRGVVGASGQISEHARYEVSYVYGQTRVRVNSLNNRITSHWLAAIDAVTDPDTGQPVCRSSLGPDPDPALAGCVPYNIFGFDVGNRAALSFINTDSESRATITQQVVSGSVSGDFGSLLKLPGGSIGYAIGAEYRREHSEFNPDALLVSGDTWKDALVPSAGGFNVKEIFAETNLPILEKVQGAHLLSLGGAVRLSDYSTRGKTTTWKLDSIYAPVASMSFRGTYSQAVRAPNISELFGARSVTFNFITDPCDINELNNGTATRAANCATLLQGLGINPGTFEPSTSTEGAVAKQGFTGGNPTLIEETAKTWTAGLVWRPAFLPSFSATADWYDIRIRNAINTATAEELSQLCVDQPTLNNPFCPNVTRSATTGFITGFEVQPQNVANFATSGLDTTFRYRYSMRSRGTLDASLVGGYVHKIEFISSPGATPRSDLAQAYFPRYSAVLDLTWRLQPVAVTYGINWFSRTNRFTDAAIAGTPNIAAPRYLQARQGWEHNLNVEYEYSGGLTLWAGATNLFNAKPEFGYRSYPVTAMGVFLYAGARANFR